MQKRIESICRGALFHPGSVAAFGTAETVPPDQSTPPVGGGGVCLKNPFEPGLHLTPINVSWVCCWHVEGCRSR